MLGRVLFLHVVIFSGVICGFAPPDRIIKVLQSFPTPKKRTVHMATVTLCDFFFFYISKVSLEHLSLLWTSLSLRVPLNLSSACRGWQLPPALIGTCLKRHLVPLSLPCHTKTPKFLLFYLPGICVCVWGGFFINTQYLSEYSGRCCWDSQVTIRLVFISVSVSLLPLRLTAGIQSFAAVVNEFPLLLWEINKDHKS